jgi:FtsH-binding integral membrane protein
MIMIWDDTATTAIGWHGGNTNNVTQLTVAPGTYFVASEIVYKQNSVQSVTLTVKTVAVMGIFSNTSLGIGDTPPILNVAVLFTIIFILLGILVFMIGRSTESGLVKIIGAVLVILALLIPSFLANLIIGTGWLHR